MRNFRTKELWVGLLPPSRPLETLIGTAQAYRVKVARRWHSSFGGASVRVLFPPRDWAASDKPQNSHSMVLNLTYGRLSLLFEGDAQKSTERRVCTLEHPNASLLKAGHHGSGNATTQELIDSARPAFAVMSVGAWNSFGLPRYETLSRLTGCGGNSRLRFGPRCGCDLLS